MTSRVEQEYGDADESGDVESVVLIPGKEASASASASATAVEREPQRRQKGRSALYILATVQAFVIVYRAEALLSIALACSVGVAISSYRDSHKPQDAFRHARIGHDYSDVELGHFHPASKYDLSLGAVDHWCLQGDDSSCRCEDPLEPASKRSSHKWNKQHTENVKVAVEAVMKATNAKSFNEIEALGDGGGTDWDPMQYGGPITDDMWVESLEDDWLEGYGSRFGSYSNSNDGGYNDLDEDPPNRDLAGKNTDLDVVFIGDSITEQRQGTLLGRDNEQWTGIKEVFDKTFKKSNGGDFEGIAMGIAGDRANNLLWRLGNGEMPVGLRPKVWWVHVGINDLSTYGCSEEIVLLGILRVVEEIQNEHPNAKIVINSMLPVRRNEAGLLEHLGKHKEHEALKKKEKDMLKEELDPKRMEIDFWPSIVSINSQLQRFASKHSGVKFFNADEIFVDERENGKYLRVDLMEDTVHPNLVGHKKWNSAIKKKLHEILKSD